MWVIGEREASCLGGSSGGSLSGFNTAIVRATELSVMKLTTAVIPPSAQAAKPQSNQKKNYPTHVGLNFISYLDTSE